MTVSRREFALAYRTVVGEVREFWAPEMQEEVALHNRGWAVGSYDFIQYLDVSIDRYYAAYCGVEGAGSVLDVGGMWGVLPMTLRRFGIAADMTECLRFYSGAFDALFDHIRASGVRVNDADPFEPDFDLGHDLDAITLMAVLEHYPNSLRALFENVRRALRPGGRLFIEVPNIAYWVHRARLAVGHSPLPGADVVYRSAVPFTGHHHEFTSSELRAVLDLAGFRVSRLSTLTYSLPRGRAVRGLHRALGWVAPGTRELLMATCVAE